MDGEGSELEVPISEPRNALISTCVQMHMILRDPSTDLVSVDGETLKMRLMKIERQVHTLNLAERFGLGTSSSWPK